MPVVPMPCGPSGDSPGPGPGAGETCCAPSITTTPARLEDGTPIVLVLRAACMCGDEPETPPVVAGWLDPATGTYTPGAAPDGVGLPSIPATVLEECRCDDADVDGVADTDYVELIAVDPLTGDLASIGTYLPDLSGRYEPVSPIGCEDASVGAEPATGVQVHRLELAAGQMWSAATVSRLQSVTATAHGGAGTVTTADGPSTLHMGESVTWSVARDGDASLTGPLVVSAGGTGTVTVTYTVGVTL